MRATHPGFEFLIERIAEDLKEETTNARSYDLETCPECVCVAICDSEVTANITIVVISLAFLWHHYTYLQITFVNPLGPKVALAGTVCALGL